MKASTLISFGSILIGAANAWLPDAKVRGVNLGSLFIVEPWMMSNSWSTMGCGGQNSEFDCVSALGQDAANTAFQGHWGSWITQADITQMVSYGLNTVRIPLGYWIVEDLVYSDSEHFPQGGFAYLEQVAQWCKDAGINIILDLHGAPGAQQANQPFTGQYAPTPGFYVDYQYERAYSFLQNITTTVHTNDAFSTVFALEVVNEPLQDQSQTTSMINTYYPTAYNTIRSAEETLAVTSDKQLHVQFMNKNWGSGDPTSALPSGYADVLGDSHDYVKWTPGVAETRDAYLAFSCADDVSGSIPVVVGEWSLSVADDAQDSDEFNKDTNSAWYGQWFSAQIQAYEKVNGWIFWSWKTELGDYRWGYQDAVTAGVIPTDLNTAASATVC